MSDRSNRAMELITRSELAGALAEARRACEETPTDSHAWYALGVALRWTEKDDESLSALERANALAPRQATVMLAIAIAKQRLGDYGGAVTVLRQLLEAEPDHVLAYNTLGMTQKLLGEPSKAAHNYDSGVRALIRGWLKRVENSEHNARLPHVRTRNDLWLEYAAYAATLVAARDDIADVAFPSGEMAIDDARTARFRGWYWEDSDGEGANKRRLFFPNFFNAVAQFLHDDGTYAHLMANRATVLAMLGDQESARRHADEADDFMSR